MYKTKKLHIKNTLVRQRIELLKTIASEEGLDETNLINKYSDVDFKSAYNSLFLNELQHIGGKIFDGNSLSSKGIDKEEFMGICEGFAKEIIGKHVTEEEVTNHTKKQIEYIDKNIDNKDNKDISEISGENKFYYDNPTTAYKIMRHINKMELASYNKTHNTNKKRVNIWGVCAIGFNDTTGRKFIVEKRVVGKIYGNTGKAIKRIN